jgi:hypothetical protein
MAKNPGKPGGTSRIKFIMLDAEIADDQIQSVTQAIANALRSPAPPSPKRLPPAAPQLNGNGAAEEHDEPDLFDALEEEGAVDVTPASTRQEGPRKPAPTPEVLPFDFNAFEMPLSVFVAAYKTESHQQRYLVASAWYHDHGGVTKVTAAHIYTAYRYLKWPLTVKDFAQPLRAMKSQQLYGSTEKGTYTINHVGLQRVAELKIASGE